MEDATWQDLLMNNCTADVCMFVHNFTMLVIPKTQKVVSDKLQVTPTLYLCTKCRVICSSGMLIIVQREGQVPEHFAQTSFSFSANDKNCFYKWYSSLDIPSYKIFET